MKGEFRGLGYIYSTYKTDELYTGIIGSDRFPYIDEYPAINTGKAEYYITDDLIDKLSGDYEIIDGPFDDVDEIIDGSHIYFHYDDPSKNYFNEYTEYNDLSNIKLWSVYAAENRDYYLYTDKIYDCVLPDNPGTGIYNGLFYDHIIEDTNYKYIKNIRGEIVLSDSPEDAEMSLPREYGYRPGHYDEMEILDRIYNPNKNYLPPENFYDYENLYMRKFCDVAITIYGSMELGPKDLLNNISYTKTINDGDSIDFTTIASASITARLNYPVEEANKLVGQNFTYLLDYGDGEWHNMGLFTIDEAESIDAYTSRITGHDHMYRLNKYVDDFIAKYKYPTTLGKF